MNLTFLSPKLRVTMFLLVALFAGTAGTALAHKPSDAYLTMVISPTQITGEWHLALRDLDYAIGLDKDDDGAITWGELRARQDALSAYAISRLQVRGDGTSGHLCVTELRVENHSDGAYAVLRFRVDGLHWPASLELNYQALFDLDPLHRGLLRLERSGSTRLAVFSPQNPTQRFDLGAPAPRHPLLTFDHVLFLVALLLPGVLRRSAKGWQPVPEIRPALVNVLKIVTAFTVAHSVTLSLAALEIVRLPPRLVESAIAATVALAAMNNLRPILPRRDWLVAFGFGLIHGFGFANALTDLGLRRGELAATLLGFNVGVEVGQLVLVATCFPLALALRNFAAYRCFVLRIGSAAISIVATAWFAERCLDFKWLPF